MQQRRSDFAGCFSHEHARIRLTTHEHRQRSDMVLMSVADENHVDRAPIDRFPTGQSPFAVIFWMHAAIQNHPFATGLEIIRVRADLGPARQVDKFHENSGQAFLLQWQAESALVDQTRKRHCNAQCQPCSGGLRPPLEQNTGVHRTRYKICSKIRIQFRKRIFSISSSLKPRSINLRVKLRAWA